MVAAGKAAFTNRPDAAVVRDPVADVEATVEAEEV